MKPNPFVPEPWERDPRYMKDKTTGLIWHESESRVLYADTDASKVVYHANYLKYYELGRTSLMRDMAYSYREVEESGFLYPIIEVGVKYFGRLMYDDAIFIYTRPESMERVKIKFEYIIVNGESRELVCKGFTQHCAVNTERVPVAIDEKTVYLWDTFPR